MSGMTSLAKISFNKSFVLICKIAYIPAPVTVVYIRESAALMFYFENIICSHSSVNVIIIIVFIWSGNNIRCLILLSHVSNSNSQI